MNERIKELGQEAGLLMYNPDGLPTKLEKFAELIVKECENSIKLVPTHFEAQDKIIVECLKAIRETFWS